MNTSSRLRAATVVAVLAASTGAYVAGQHGNLANAAVTATPASTAAVAATDFSGIVNRYGPAVVNISVVGHARQVPAVADSDDEQDDDGPLAQLFPRGMAPGMQPPAIQRGLGSGFIVSSDGIVMTNAHVVDGADEVTVRLTDRREFKAKVVGVDKRTDIAVLRIAATGLPTVKLGDPSSIKVGEPVLAIGSPFGFENSASAGIVSATSRTLPSETLVPFIQTDVALNPGNSGGPLFNVRGEVIGVNSQIYSRTGGYQGLSFAIPIDTARAVEEQLLAHGKVTRSRLGVTIQEMSQPLADAMGLKSVTGALLSSVEKGSPAEKAGLKPGDVVLAWNGAEINRAADLPGRVASAAPGSSNKVDIARDGKRQSVEVKVVAAGQAPAVADSAAHGKLGLAVRPLDASEIAQAGVTSGLLVEGASGPAARSGIAAGDIVLAVNGKTVGDVEQMRKLVEQGGKQIAILVQRDGARMFVPVQVG